MNGWPAFDVLTAQQAYWEWLKRAHQHGLKMIVMLAVNNSVLCQLALHRASFGCGDDGAVNRQIQGAKDLEDYIDAREGGPGEGFYRIVYNSEEARTAIQAGKMAVVLSTEWTPPEAASPALFCNDIYIHAASRLPRRRHSRGLSGAPDGQQVRRHGGLQRPVRAGQLHRNGIVLRHRGLRQPDRMAQRHPRDHFDLKVAVDALIVIAILTLWAAYLLSTLRCRASWRPSR